MAAKSYMAGVVEGFVDALNVTAYTDLSLGGVWALPPETVAYPYTWVAATPTAEDAFGAQVHSAEVRVHVFSATKSILTAGNIMSKAAELLHHMPLTTPGWTHLLTDYLGDVELGVELIENVAVYHYMSRYRAFGEAT